MRFRYFLMWMTFDVVFILGLMQLAAMTYSASYQSVDVQIGWVIGVLSGMLLCVYVQFFVLYSLKYVRRIISRPEGIK